MGDVFVEFKIDIQPSVDKVEAAERCIEDMLYEVSK